MEKNCPRLADDHASESTGDIPHRRVVDPLIFAERFGSENQNLERRVKRSLYTDTSRFGK